MFEKVRPLMARLKTDVQLDIVKQKDPEEHLTLTRELWICGIILETLGVGLLSMTSA